MQPELSKEDWQLIAGWVQDRYTKAVKLPGDPPRSKAHKDEEDRIMGFLLRKAYPRETQS